MQWVQMLQEGKRPLQATQTHTCLWLCHKITLLEAWRDPRALTVCAVLEERLL